MSPCCACEENRRFISPVGSPFDDRNKLRGSSGPINCDRYNSDDGPLRLNVLNRISVFYDVATYPLNK